MQARQAGSVLQSVDWFSEHVQPLARSRSISPPHTDTAHGKSSAGEKHAAVMPMISGGKEIVAVESRIGSQQGIKLISNEYISSTTGCSQNFAKFFSRRIESLDACMKH